MEKQKSLHISVCVCVLACLCLCVCSGCGWTEAGVFLCACSLTNPAYNAPPYCHLRPLWLHHVFPRYLINGTIFGRKLFNIKCVFWFSLQLLSNRCLILRRIQWVIVTNMKTSSCKVFFIIFRILMKLECKHSQVPSKRPSWSALISEVLIKPATSKHYFGGSFSVLHAKCLFLASLEIFCKSLLNI